jgi:D-alanyl-D-alanine carboxypeptidase
MAAAPAPSQPVIVYTGPKKTGPALIAALAVETEKQTPRRGKKGRAAANKPVATADAKTEAKDAKSDAKSDTRVSVTIDPNAPVKRAAKPAARHASAKPDAAAAKPADKPAAAAVKPAKPKAATKPAPRNSTTGEAKPAADQKTAAAPRT